MRTTPFSSNKTYDVCIPIISPVGLASLCPVRPTHPQPHETSTKVRPPPLRVLQIGRLYYLERWLWVKLYCSKLHAVTSCAPSDGVMVSDRFDGSHNRPARSRRTVYCAAHELELPCLASRSTPVVLPRAPAEFAVRHNIHTFYAAPRSIANLDLMGGSYRSCSAPPHSGTHRHHGGLCHGAI
ncbi:hypothetical protein LZ31DRAFT_104748 [Colletotrichum somersetense]|nr:hypothetical protein LZ31DRAFT_104748 [Colletotrichum somersetense]